MKNKPKGLFVLFEGINSTIFNSQVIEHISKLDEYDFEVLSFNTESPLWKTSLDNKKKLLKTHRNIKIHLVKSINIFYPFAFIFHVLQLIIFLKKSDENYTFIHSRADYTQFIVLISRFIHKINSVWDCRGDSISEIKHSLTKKNIIYKVYGFLYIIPFFKFLIYTNLVYSKAIIFVSELLKKNLFKLFNSKSKSCVIPCLVNHKLFFYDLDLRKLMRNKYNIKNNETVFVYSGSMVAYQSFEHQLNFYKNLFANKNNILLILTNQTEKAEKFFDQFQKRKVIIKSVEFNEVNNYYNMSDFAILIRDNNLLNQVASPTKFGEYCLSGLKVLMNKNVHQSYRNALRINNFVNINNFNLDNTNSETRSLISTKSKKYYCRDNYVGHYKSLYDSIIDCE